MPQASERPRPRDLSEAELGFRMQTPVAWLAPRVLLATGFKTLVATIFGAYADKRELQGSLPSEVHSCADGEDELWWDYVADVGDGFDATYSIASLLAADELTLNAGHGEKVSLPRGRLLMMGGDQVYPAASTQGYEDRSKGPYRAAFPESPEPHPTMFALPGNHDWYDGLTAFLRIFGQQRDIGGWHTEQHRSYFAVKLPQQWWLYAIDTQFDDYIDAPQLAYFRTAAQQLQPGDGVILCTPSPSWVKAGDGSVKGYDAIEFFRREIIEPTGATVPVMLSGDHHHYARYTEVDGHAQRITSGAGGAYLVSTHRMPEQLTLPPPQSRAFHDDRREHFKLATRYPDKRTSAGLSLGILRLPWRNPGFATFVGIVHTLLLLSLVLGRVAAAQPDAGAIGLVPAWTPAVITAAVIVVGCYYFAKLDMGRARSIGVLIGALHGLAHVALGVGWLFVVEWLHYDVFGKGGVADWLIVVIALAATPLLIGLVGAELVAAYLLLAGHIGVNMNEVFAGQAIEDFKGFLRLHIGTDGTLTVYPIKLHRVVHSWELSPEKTGPWLRPKGRQLRPALIEHPIRVPRVSSTEVRTATP